MRCLNIWMEFDGRFQLFTRLSAILTKDGQTISNNINILISSPR